MAEVFQYGENKIETSRTDEKVEEGNDQEGPHRFCSFPILNPTLIESLERLSSPLTAK